MRPVRHLWLAATLVVTLAAGNAGAQWKGELVEVRKIWDQAPHNALTDLVRFKDRWFCVCREGQTADSPDGVVRVLSSADGTRWESAALLKSPDAGHGLGYPKITVTPDGQLMITAAGSTPRNTLEPLTWHSKDGRAWGEPVPANEPNHWPGRVTWHKGTGYTYSVGVICGIVQTIRINGSTDNGKTFTRLDQHTYSGFMPNAAALVFEGDTAYCLMSRTGGPTGKQPGLLGTAKAPFDRWEWKALDTGIRVPNLLRLADGRVVAAVGLYDQKPRTSLCAFDPKTGKLTEFLELPIPGELMDVGLAAHDGHLWVSFHAPHAGKTSVHLAKVKLVAR